MRSLHYILFALLVCIVVGCERIPASKASSSKDPEFVELTIKLKGGVELKVPIELNGSSKASHSFSEDEAVGRNLGSNVSFSYVGEVDLEDNYSIGAPIRGHVIAFLISQFDPDLKKATFSEVHYEVYSGESKTIFNDRGIHLSIKPISEPDDQTLPAVVD